MIIQLENQIPEAEKAAIEARLKQHKYAATEVLTQTNRYFVAVGKAPIDLRVIGHMPGVRDIHQITDNFQLVSRQWKVDRTIIDLGDGVTIGGKDFAWMVGPCSIEGEDQVEKVAQKLAESGIKIMRGGVYKPRSSPYSFRGMGMEGMKMWHSICKPLGIKIITEVMEQSQIEGLYPYVDIFQVGARNSKNYNLLEALGKCDKPVLIKRGISGTIDELLFSAEYVFGCGNERLMLCERGIRTYESAYRNTLDVNAIPILKEKSHLPVIIDPSHGIGIRQFVPPMAKAGLVAGADGILLEAHPIPEKAFSDGQQTLNFAELAKLRTEMARLQAAL